MLIDDITITATAGKGGDGHVSFEKDALALGPTGGAGGHGGSIYMEGVSDLGALRQFRYKKKLHARNGEQGRRQRSEGPDGDDLIIKIPVGTVIRNLTKKTEEEITSVGQHILVVKGGRGGKGNFFFRSSRNTTPLEYEEGKPGEEAQLRLELKMIADVGYIGLPNSGKSSLLNSLTRAQSKVGDYAFTTLEPHLGNYYGLILADIPGLIEGASGGKGLGHKFLRHIERTRVIFHLISSESEDPVADYRTIRGELDAYSEKLKDKKEYVFLTKADLSSPEEIDNKIKALEEAGTHADTLSIYDKAMLDKLEEILRGIIREKSPADAQQS